MKQGYTFTSTYFTGRVEVIEATEATNQLKVHLTQKRGENEFSQWEENWNLGHTIIGFSHGDYFERPFPGDWPPLLYQGEIEVQPSIKTKPKFPNHPELNDLQKITEVSQRKNGSYSFFLEGLGIMDYYPKSNRLCNRSDNEWKDNARDLIAELVLDRAEDPIPCKNEAKKKAQELMQLCGKAAMVCVKQMLEEHSCYTLNDGRWAFWSQVEIELNKLS